MSKNIFKLIVVCLVITAALYFLANPILSVLGLADATAAKHFVIGVSLGGLLASLLTGILLMIKPYDLPIHKKTLFVGNLAFKATDHDLRQLFTDYGEVFSIRLMTDRHTRKPRGYGFVEMDAGGAQKAMSALNEAEFMGRNLRVSPANEPAQKNS